MNICFLAGEASGDLHGARVVSELKKLLPDCHCWGMVGEQMQAAGCEVNVDAREMAVMGFAEVIRHLPLIRKNEKLLRNLVMERKPEVVIAIDYPGFNLRFAKWLRTAFPQEVKRPRLLGYISPQVWAWKSGRIKQIAATYDGLAVVFPFEVDTYRNVELDVRFVGHPLLEELPLDESKVAAREKVALQLRKPGFDANAKMIAFLPGSRTQEMKRHSQLLADTFKLLKISHPSIIGIAPALTQLDRKLYAPMEEVGILLVFDDASSVVRAADAAAVASGTATLQTALLGTPMVVLYRTSPISYEIGKRVVKVPYISLANLVMNDLVAPERIQGAATPEQLSKDLSELLGETGQKQLTRFSGLRAKLGGIGASKRVAEWALELAGSPQ